MDATREVTTIAGQEIRRTVRSARVVALLVLYGIFSAVVVLIIHLASRVVDQQVDAFSAQADPEQVRAATEEARQKFLAYWFSEDKDLLTAVADIPIALLVIFHLSLYWLPLYVALMGFDQISAEVGPRSIRYLTVRARRGTILLGKFAGQAAVLLLLMAVIQVAVFVYAKVRYPDFGLLVMAVTFAKFGLAAFTFSLAYLALSSLCSAAFRTPMVSLIANIVALFLFWLVHLIGRVAAGLGEEGTAKAVSFVQYASPSYYAGKLLHPLPMQFGVSVLAYAAFALLFLGLAWFILRARDV